MLKEIMDYNNLTKRSFTSFFLIILFFLFLNFLEIYIPYFLILIYGVILYEILFYFKNKKDKYFLLIVYLIVSFVCSELFFAYYYEKYIFIFFVVLIVSFDTFSYILGSLFGKKKLMPTISPNKTILGLISGLFITLIISIIFNYFFEIFDYIIAVFFSILVLLSAFTGDFIESYYKRLSNIKNSSNIIPGHGGLFDRLDSFIMCIIMILIFSYFK